LKLNPSLIKPLAQKGSSFHKIEIIKFTHLRDWGQPWKSKPLKDHSFEYSYYDYIDAWYKILLFNFLICPIPGSSNSQGVPVY
jgi:hypothetical protein